VGVLGVLGEGESWFDGAEAAAVTLRLLVAILVSKLAFHFGHWCKIDQQPSYANAFLISI
jgi:hypothetical protein